MKRKTELNRQNNVAKCVKVPAFTSKQTNKLFSRFHTLEFRMLFTRN